MVENVKFMAVQHAHNNHQPHHSFQIMAQNLLARCVAEIVLCDSFEVDDLGSDEVKRKMSESATMRQIVVANGRGRQFAPLSGLGIYTQTWKEGTTGDVCVDNLTKG